MFPAHADSQRPHRYAVGRIIHWESSTGKIVPSTTTTGQIPRVAATPVSGTMPSLQLTSDGFTRRYAGRISSGRAVSAGSLAMP